MRVLVTGHRGYIGSVMLPMLLEAGHEVVGLDADWFAGCDFGCPLTSVRTLQMDLRDVTPEHCEGFDAVIHLAALSNDALGVLNPGATEDINVHGSIRLARCAKASGVKRFLFSSSCSLYGAAGEGMLREDSGFAPVTPYARSKILSEQAVALLADAEFAPVFLRNATAYGLSPRLRVDLVVNNLVGYAVTTGRVLLHSDGLAWRPFVHVEDIARAFLAVLEAPVEAVHNEIFNVGSTGENLQILDVAHVVRDVVPGCEISVAATANHDRRNYRVDFSKIDARVPSFRAAWTVRRGVEQLYQAFRARGFNEEAFSSPRYRRVETVRELQRFQRLDSNLRRINSTSPALRSLDECVPQTLEIASVGRRITGRTSCPSCSSTESWIFYEANGVPVHDVLLMRTRAAALAFPTGDIRLAFCSSCGFVWNEAFDPSQLRYSEDYEETQAFSPTFNAFHRRLAEHLIARYQLRHQHILEIGCGKGEFLTLLCELGPNTGTGFDPSYVSDRTRSAARGHISFIRDFYSEAHAGEKADLVCCKMTLEHIPDPARFVGMVRRSVDAHAKTIVFFQVPNLSRILHDVAFWDIYYEHCSYFSRPSLAALFRRRGFEVLDLREEYDGQYLCLEARPGRLTDGARAEEEYGELESLKRDVAHFAASCRRRREEWKSRLEEFRRRGQTVVIWGAGSKAVAFLTTLQARDAIGHAVDINPYKHGTYLPGGGQQILRPELLRELRPDVVIVMNPIYRHEIQRDLEQMGLSPLLMTV